jgi:hypothetical protein
MIGLMTPGVSGLRLFSQRRMVNYYKTILVIEIYEPAPPGDISRGETGAYA